MKRTAPCRPAASRGGSTSRPTKCSPTAGPSGSSTPIARCDADRGVEGVLVDYRHFYGGFDTSPAIANGIAARSAPCDSTATSARIATRKGFRVGAAQRRVRAVASGAVMHHYGWARPVWALAAKRRGRPRDYRGGPGLPAGSAAVAVDSRHHDIHRRPPRGCARLDRTASHARTPGPALCPASGARQVDRIALARAADWLAHIGIPQLSLGSESIIRITISGRHSGPPTNAPDITPAPLHQLCTLRSETSEVPKIAVHLVRMSGQEPEERLAIAGLRPPQIEKFDLQIGTLRHQQCVQRFENGRGRILRRPP